MSSYFIPRERDHLFRRLELLEPGQRSISGHYDTHDLLLHLANGVAGFVANQPPVRPAPFLSRTLVKWLILHLIPWPEREPRDAASLAAFTAGRTKSSFGADFATFVELLREFDAKHHAGSLQPHPHFGQMSADDWGGYMFLHIDWHLTRFGV